MSDLHAIAVELRRIADALEARNQGSARLAERLAEPTPAGATVNRGVPGVWTDAERIRWRLGVGRKGEA